MNYATWQLSFANPEYGTGPEAAIAKLGANAEGSWVSGQVEEDGTILGYVSDLVDTTTLVTWNFAFVTETEALAFCQAINPEAYFLEDGRITLPMPELI